MARAIVQVRSLFKSFVRGSEEIKVLQDLNLDVGVAEFLTLMGPSGSGKTTLLNLIAGLDQPTSGTILVGDQIISDMSESQLARWRTRNVGFIFQFYYLLPVLTAFENVELPLLLLPMSARQRREQVNKALDLVGLSDRTRHRPGQLSGGQQQRVGIARAIVTDPTLIVADEPTGDLDSKSATEILSIMELLRSQLGKTIIMVTHDPHAAERSQRILHLEKGRLVMDTANGAKPVLDALPAHPSFGVTSHARRV
jgi:putative ABC transport system ATP-binding protein